MTTTIHAHEAPSFDLPGLAFTGLASPTRGSAELCTWRLTVEPGFASPSAHVLDRDEVFVVVSGSIQVTPDDSPVVAGGAAVVPAGAAPGRRHRTTGAGADVASRCLARGDVTTVTGRQTTRYRDDPGAGATVDARGAWWLQVDNWPITIGANTYAYRAWGAVGNNLNHTFYVSNNLTSWTEIYRGPLMFSDPGGVLSTCLGADRTAAFRCLHIVGFGASCPALSFVHHYTFFGIRLRGLCSRLTSASNTAFPRSPFGSAADRVANL